MIGLLWCAGLLLAVSGVAKLRDPAPARLALAAAGFRAGRAGSVVARAVGVGEVVAAAVVVVVGGRVAGGVVAVSFVALAAVAARMLRVAPTVGCGCFGASSSPVSRWHVATDLALAAAGGLALLMPPPATAAALTSAPFESLLVAVLATALAYALTQLMTSLPAMPTGGSGVVAR